jgi:hypothetical protein
LVLDKNGHTEVTNDVEAEYKRLIAQGYASFVDNIQVKELPASGDVLMLAPLAGG